MPQGSKHSAIKVKPAKASNTYATSQKTAAKPAETMASAMPSISMQKPWKDFVKTSGGIVDQQRQHATQFFTDQTEKASTHMMNNMNDFSSLYRDMTAATQQYCQTWTKGCEELSRSYMSFCQSLTQDCMSAFKTTLSARTVQDAVSSQNEFLRAQCEKIVSETTRMGEQLAKTASEAAEPVQSQWSTMTAKMTPSNTTSRAA